MAEKKCRHSWEFLRIDNLVKDNMYATKVIEKCEKCHEERESQSNWTYQRQVQEELDRRRCPVCQLSHLHEAPSGPKCVELLAEKIRRLEERLDNASFHV